MSARLRIYVGAVMLAAVALLLTHVPHDLEQRGGHYLAWVLLCALSDSMWLRALSGEGSSSMGSTAGLATAIMWGQGPSMWIVGSSTWLAELIVQRKGWLRASFNASQVAITMWATCGVFALLGGPIGGLAGVALVPGVRTALQLAVPILAMFATYLLVNRSLVAVAIAWSTERPYLRVLRDDWFYADKLLADFAAFLLSPLMVIAFRAIDYFGMVLFYAPLRMIHESTRRYNELQNAQKQIIHSERMAAKGEMAAEVGHELRNQLAAISGRAQMLLRDAAKGQVENVSRHAEIVLEQSKRMEALSKGLMDFSRAELTVERISLNPLVQRSIEFVRTQNRFDGVEWEFELEEPSPELRADPGQLQQVLLNLFLNAADAMKEREGTRRVIRVRTASEPRARTVQLIVSDTGGGIPASNLSKIFEPHFTTKATGHGFGLSTSYRIIMNHGGKIVAESQPDSGATFTVTLPQNRDGGWSTGR